MVAFLLPTCQKKQFGIFFDLHCCQLILCSQQWNIHLAAVASHSCTVCSLLGNLRFDKSSIASSAFQAPSPKGEGKWMPFILLMNGATPLKFNWNSEVCKPKK
jgi:hypothetical protein